MCKTRIAEALHAEAEELGFHTLRGAAHAEEGRAPYTPLAEALDPLAERPPHLAARARGAAPRACRRAQRGRPGRARAAVARGARPHGQFRRAGDAPSRLLGGRAA